MVVAVTLTGAPAASERAASASARREPIRGRLPITCTATLPTSQPALRSRRAVSASSATPAAPAHSGSEVPKCEPRSPSPAAESSASQAAWAATSPSEWPGQPLRLLGPGEPREVHRDAVGEAVDVGADADAECGIHGIDHA